MKPTKQIPASGFQFNKRAIRVISIGLLLLAGSGPGAIRVQADGEELRVGSCQDAQYATIQAAVAAAALMPGTQKIHVCEGTYTENVIIGPNNPVEIFGDGRDKTFVRPVPLTPGPVFDATDSDTVKIEKLTVDGLSLMTGTPLGIRYLRTSGLIKDTAVVNIRDVTGASPGVGIRIDGPAATVRVEDNRVLNWTRVGIMGNGLGVNIQIEDNLIIGPTPPKIHAPNGVQVSRGAVGLVKGNVIYDASIGLVPPNAGSGILCFCAGPTTVEGNKISDSDTGVNLEDNANARVIGNEVSDSAYDAYPLLSGVAVFFGDPIGGLGCPGGVQATIGNFHEGNKAFENGRDAVHLEGFAVLPGPSNNDILNTDIKTSGRDGLRVVNGAGNRFFNNTMEKSVEHDAHDDQIPTPNSWKDNNCKSASKENQPGLLCKN